MSTAALNILDADLFALNGKVRDWMDPSAGAMKDVEGHHLFPQNYLRTYLKIDTPKRLNQVANFAPTDWSTNNFISDRPPSDYWPELVAARHITGTRLADQQFWHALPDSWETMAYEDFLARRRALMAVVTRAGFLRLSDPSYDPKIEGASPADPVKTADVTLSDLFAAGVVKAGDMLRPVDPERDSVAEITDDGLISLDGHVYDTPRRAAIADGNESSDGWEYWETVDDPPRLLSSLADTLRSTT